MPLQGGRTRQRRGQRTAAAGEIAAPKRTVERERLLESAAAGATWYQWWIRPGEPAEVRAFIGRGPLRID
ncbi:MAG TPA: hypothetical protein VKV26_23560 [Dehalococcoidia bacterium]|nr:hypothetical protein [Dehalococcoidia bacterium]